jgi:hypothetical protein
MAPPVLPCQRLPLREIHIKFQTDSLIWCLFTRLLMAQHVKNNSGGSAITQIISFRFYLMKS